MSCDSQKPQGPSPVSVWVIITVNVTHQDFSLREAPLMLGWVKLKKTKKQNSLKILKYLLVNSGLYIRYKYLGISMLLSYASLHFSYFKLSKRPLDTAAQFCSCSEHMNISEVQHWHTVSVPLHPRGVAQLWNSSKPNWENNIFLWIWLCVHRGVAMLQQE